MIPLPSSLRKWVEELAASSANTINPKMQRIQTARTAAWTLLTRPHLEGRALLIVKSPSASAFLLSNFFQEVHLFVASENLCTELQRFYNEFCRLSLESSGAQGGQVGLLLDHC